MAEEWVSEKEMLEILAGSRRTCRHWLTQQQFDLLSAELRAGTARQVYRAWWEDGGLAPLPDGRAPVQVDATDGGRDWLQQLFQQLA
jgi:hypothetical protein